MINKDMEKSFFKAGLFENFVYNLFKDCGLDVNYGDSYRKNITYVPDLILFYEKDHSIRKYVCEIKFSLNKELNFDVFNRSIDNLLKSIDHDVDLLLITNALCTDEEKKIAKKKHVNIFDLSNFLYLLKENEDLYVNFISFLNFSSIGIIPKNPSLGIRFKNVLKKKGQRSDDDGTNFTSLEEKEIYKKMSTWRQRFDEFSNGKDDFSGYESLCREVIDLLFSDYLDIRKPQVSSNDGLFRFDLICKTKYGVNDEFFWTLNQFFNTKYIVFEFKNYTKKITQREIYTTEKYLYDKALRKVAIIISNHGEDVNASKAIRGSLREQGKLIISLSNNDLLNMLENHYRTSDPMFVTHYLTEKLDEILIELEK